MSAARRGKYAEGKVRDWLKQYKGDRATFTYNRILDAHSSKGAMSAPQVGDYQWFMDTGVRVTYAPRGLPDGAWTTDYERNFTRNGVIEIKETQHAHRLEYHSFGVDQVGRMRIREMAGSEALVLVCHRPEKGEYAGKTFWRSAPLEFFMQRPGGAYGSWDLSEIPAYTHCDDILKEYLK